MAQTAQLRPVQAEAQGFSAALDRWFQENAQAAVRSAILGALTGYAISFATAYFAFTGPATFDGAGGTFGGLFRSTVFTGIATTILFSLFGYWKAVGTEKFFQDIGRFPSMIAGLFSRDGRNARAHFLWGCATGLLSAQIVSPWIGAVTAIGVIAAAPSIVGAALGNMLRNMWSGFVRSVSPTRGMPVDAPTAVVVGMLGAAATLLAGQYLPGGNVPLIAAACCVLLAFLMRGSGTAAPGAAAVLAGVLLTGAFWNGHAGQARAQSGMSYDQCVQHYKSFYGPFISADYPFPECEGLPPQTSEAPPPAADDEECMCGYSPSMLERLNAALGGGFAGLLGGFFGSGLGGAAGRGVPSSGGGGGSRQPSPPPRPEPKPAEPKPAEPVAKEPPPVLNPFNENRPLAGWRPGAPPGADGQSGLPGQVLWGGNWVDPDTARELIAESLAADRRRADQSDAFARESQEKSAEWMRQRREEGEREARQRAETERLRQAEEKRRAALAEGIENTLSDMAPGDARRDLLRQLGEYMDKGDTQSVTEMWRQLRGERQSQIDTYHAQAQEYLRQAEREDWKAWGAEKVLAGSKAVYGAAVGGMAATPAGMVVAAAWGVGGLGTMGAVEGGLVAEGGQVRFDMEGAAKGFASGAKSGVSAAIGGVQSAGSAAVAAAKLGTQAALDAAETYAKTGDPYKAFTSGAISAAGNALGEVIDGSIANALGRNLANHAVNLTASTAEGVNQGQSFADALKSGLEGEAWGVVSRNTVKRARTSSGDTPTIDGDYDPARPRAEPDGGGTKAAKVPADGIEAGGEATAAGGKRRADATGERAKGVAGQTGDDVSEAFEHYPTAEPDVFPPVTRLKPDPPGYTPRPYWKDAPDIAKARFEEAKDLHGLKKPLEDFVNKLGTDAERVRDAAINAEAEANANPGDTAKRAAADKLLQDAEDAEQQHFDAVLKEKRYKDQLDKAVREAKKAQADIEATKAFNRPLVGHDYSQYPDLGSHNDPLRKAVSSDRDPLSKDIADELVKRQNAQRHAAELDEVAKEAKAEVDKLKADAQKARDEAAKNPNQKGIKQAEALALDEAAAMKEKAATDKKQKAADAQSDIQRHEDRIEELRRELHERDPRRAQREAPEIVLQREAELKARLDEHAFEPSEKNRLAVKDAIDDVKQAKENVENANARLKQHQMQEESEVQVLNDLVRKYQKLPPGMPQGKLTLVGDQQEAHFQYQDKFGHETKHPINEIKDSDDVSVAVAKGRMQAEGMDVSEAKPRAKKETILVEDPLAPETTPIHKPSDWAGYNSGDDSVSPDQFRTKLHEVTHANTSVDFRRTHGGNREVLEGFNELYTRDTARRAGLDVEFRGVYQDQFRVASRISEMVGRGVAQKAHFGDASDLAAFHAQLGKKLGIGDVSQQEQSGKDLLARMNTLMEKGEYDAVYSAIKKMKKNDTAGAQVALYGHTL